MEQLSIKIDLFRPIVDLNHIEIIATIDQTPKFGSKMLIKRRLEYDLDRNLAQGRSNCISLLYSVWSVRHFCLQPPPPPGLVLIYTVYTLRYHLYGYKAPLIFGGK